MEDVWIMDSGCSRHMTGHRKWFSNLNPVSTKEYITFRDNGQGKALGVGSVSLSTKLYLRDVAFVWNLGFNLVSVSQLLDEGFGVQILKNALHRLTVRSPRRSLVACTKAWSPSVTEVCRSSIEIPSGPPPPHLHQHQEPCLYS